ncbi:methyltransferase [Desulfobacter postgatei]|jgi:predicted nicotinamide N-methyase|uniref:Putative methyltransferase n=1 Tax=Desulfobacter postgatei 2ac9 TaxID=879212 RepID=I5AYM4_9BACT|nr:methyltransferase domain-containing protein [Desulfobacter postgatei]EIM62337.1 putative methyltransferase [Desulfobacter postgatei 2ac9]MDX9962965.1 methyltransferase domain-containing protein [Desulfobacter postgatei]
MSTIRVRYTTIEIGAMDIHIRTLRDTLQFEDINGEAERLGISSATWPIFGVVWPSSCLLARLMLDHYVNGKRVLEVGCGIGLASLILNQRLADITATDYHPETEGFLIHNVKLNDGKKIPFVRTGWADLDDDLGHFDLIIGSDLLYEIKHVDLLSTFINRHARDHCDVIIVDPRRGYHAKFSKKMAGLGYACSQEKINQTDSMGKSVICQVLTFSRQDII